MKTPNLREVIPGQTLRPNSGLTNKKNLAAAIAIPRGARYHETVIWPMAMTGITGAGEGAYNGSEFELGFGEQDMGCKTIRSAIVVFGLTAAMAAWADAGGSLNSYQQSALALAGVHDDELAQNARRGLSEYTEWAFIAIGLVLIGAVAHRRQTRI
jgi:hypothetical protein